MLLRNAWWLYLQRKDASERLQSNAFRLQCLKQILCSLCSASATQIQTFIHSCLECRFSMASENEVITMESSCHHMTKCTSLNKLPHSKRWIQQITIISNYWIRLSYDLKNYADFGGNYPLRRITPSEICIILKVIRKPNPVLVLLFIWKSNYKG